MDVWELLPAEQESPNREGVQAKPLVKLEEGDKVGRSVGQQGRSDLGSHV
jgi:hypothetical protein